MIFFPFLEEEESRYEEPTTPSPSPTNPSTPSSSSSSGSSSERPPHMRSLQELYKVTENLNDDLNLFCHFADWEPIGFEKAVKDEKWRIAMDEEIKAIEKNNTWELTTIPKEQKPIGEKWVVKTRKNEEGERVDSTIFKSLVESLRYLTRPDILYEVELISRYMESPTSFQGGYKKIRI